MVESIPSRSAAGLFDPGSTPPVPSDPFHGLPTMLKPPPPGYASWWDFHEGMKGWLKEEGTRAAAPAMGEQNSQTLRSLAQALKTVRKDIGSENKEKAALARRQLIGLIAYLNGLLDGRRVVTAYPGLLGLAQSTTGGETLDETLAKLESALDDAATATRTGAGWAAAATLGGLGLLAHGVGFALDYAADAVK